MCFEVQHASTGTHIFFSLSCLLSLLRLCSTLTAKTICVKDCIRVHVHIRQYCTVSILVFFLLWLCVHKSRLNAFPRSELVAGNVVTHLICVPSAWLSQDWPHLTPPAGSITDPHLSHFLSTTYTPPSLFPFQWLQVYKVTQGAGGSRKVCQRQIVWQGKTKGGQDGPESTHCPPPYLPLRTHLQLPPCHRPTSCQDTTERGEKWEGEKKNEGQRETEAATRCSRWQSRSCRPGGREDARENMVTPPVIRGKHSQLYYKSWLIWKFNTTTHYCYINPLFSALCAKPVPFLSFSFSSLSFYLSLFMLSF